MEIGGSKSFTELSKIGSNAHQAKELLIESFVKEESKFQSFVLLYGTLQIILLSAKFFALIGPLTHVFF